MSRVETSAVIREVRDEREAQDQKWGEQNHPDGTGLPYTHDAEYQKRVTDSAAEAGSLTWRDILLEEVYEALAEDDFARLREELIQVAAVAVGWVEAIDRRGV